MTPLATSRSPASLAFPAGVFALLALLVFSPVVTRHQVLSPLDLFFSRAPWDVLAKTLSPAGGTYPDAAWSHFPVIVAARQLRDFVWNPWIASGTNGWISPVSATISPLVLPVAMAASAPLVFMLIVFLKLAVGFGGAYLWLHEESGDPASAATGAAVFAGSGIYAVWWLSQATCVTSLYPFVLFAVARARNGKRLSVGWVTLLGVSFLAAGFPAPVVYIVPLTVIAAVPLFAAVTRRQRLHVLFVAGSAIVASVLVAWPAVAPFLRFLRASGYLTERAGAGSAGFYPPEHLWSLARGFRLFALGQWIGDPRLGADNSFVESTLYVGPAAIALGLLGLANRSARGRLLWFGVICATLLAMTGVPGISTAVALLPGIGLARLTRLRWILPLGFAFLAAAGVQIGARTLGRKQTRALWLCACLVAVTVPLGLFARASLPFVDPDFTIIPDTPATSFLRDAIAREPGRFVATGDWMRPNSAQLHRLEDIRCHFTSEYRYRALLRRVDFHLITPYSTVTHFDAATMDLGHSVLRMLNVRYLAARDDAAVIARRLQESRLHDAPPSVQHEISPIATFPLDVPPGACLLTAEIAVQHAAGALRVSVRDSRRNVVWNRFVPAHEPRMTLYIPAPANGTIELQPAGTTATVPVARSGSLATASFALPWFPVYSGTDAAIYESVDALPRFFAPRRIERGSFDPLVDKVDFATTAIIDPGVRGAPEAPSELREEPRVEIARAGGGFRISTHSAGPFLLASSEKLNLNLRVSIDGTDVAPLRVNGIFAGVIVPGGIHRVDVWRSLPTVDLTLFIAGLAVLAIAILVSRRTGDQLPTNSGQSAASPAPQLHETERVKRPPVERRDLP